MKTIALALGLVLSLFVTIPEPTSVGPMTGPSALVSQFIELTSPSGTAIALPLWACSPPARVLNLTEEIDVTVATFSASWGKEVRPTKIIVYPYGFMAFPSDISSSGLVRAQTNTDTNVVVVAMDLGEGPYFPALAHELVHVADSSIEHSAMGGFDDPRAKAAIMSVVKALSER